MAARRNGPAESSDLTGRRWAISGLALVAAAAVSVLDRDRTLGSTLGADAFQRSLGWVGLLGLGQALWWRYRVIDLSAGAQMAVASMLVVGLESTLSLPAVVAIVLLAGVVVGLSCAAAMTVVRAPRFVVTLVPVALVPALLPESRVGLAPEPIRVFADGTLGESVPWLAAVWYAAALLGLAASAWGRRKGRLKPSLGLLLAGAGAGLLWAVLGIWSAGLDGPAASVSMVPVVVGAGVALLASPVGKLDLCALLGSTLAVALCLWAASTGATPLGGGIFGPGAPWVAGAVLLLALWLDRRSTDPDDSDRGRVDPPATAIDHLDSELSPRAGRHVPD